MYSFQDNYLCRNSTIYVTKFWLCFWKSVPILSNSASNISRSLRNSSSCKGICLHCSFFSFISRKCQKHLLKEFEWQLDPDLFLDEDNGNNSTEVCYRFSCKWAYSDCHHCLFFICHDFYKFLMKIIQSDYIYHVQSPLLSSTGQMP